jgi:hypothetical protein
VETVLSESPVHTNKAKGAAKTLPDPKFEHCVMMERKQNPLLIDPHSIKPDPRERLNKTTNDDDLPLTNATERTSYAKLSDYCWLHVSLMVAAFAITLVGSLKREHNKKSKTEDISIKYERHHDKLVASSE